MDCLKNYIGIRGCGLDEPESGLYVNQLPGISIEQIDKLADSEQLTFHGVWNDVQERSIRQFNTLVTSYFRKKYRLKKIVDRLEIGYPFDVNEVRVDDGEFRGVLIEMNPNQHEPRISSLMSVVLTEFRFGALADADIEFIIADADHNAIYWKETISVKADEWTAIKARFETPVNELPRNLAIGYNVPSGEVIQGVKTNIDHQTSGGGCGCDCACISTCDCSARVRGFVVPNGSSDVEYFNDNSFGLRGFISLQCSYDGLICANKEIFATAFMYLLGYNLMWERVNSPRLNKFTTVDLKRAEKLKKELDELYREELDLVVDGIDLNDFGCCLECNPVVSYVSSVM